MTHLLGTESANFNISNIQAFPKKLPTGITFSFSAGGWLQLYMFGVCHALQQSGVIDHYNQSAGLLSASTSRTASTSTIPSTNRRQDKDNNHFDINDDDDDVQSHTPTTAVPSTTSFQPRDNNNNNNNNNTNGEGDSTSSPTNAFGGGAPSKLVRFVGASAGALAASCLAGELDMNEVRDFTIECGDHMNSKWYHFFFMKDYIDIAINKFAAEIMSRDEESGTHEIQDRLRQTLGIYCTVLPWFKKKKFNEFGCVDDIKEALFASLCAAPMVGLPFRLRSTGELVVDGGIAAFQPKSGKSNVVTVSPFYFANADIRPSQFIPMLWAFRPPSSKKAHAALFDLGYNDAIDWLVRKSYIAPQNSAFIRKPDPKAPRRGVFAIFRDLVFLLLTYILVRPIAIVVVYFEMTIMASYYFVRAFISSTGEGGAAIVDWFETMTNLCSPSVFMHMAVSPRIPVNERRLAKRSFSFRVFAPIFGKPADVVEAEAEQQQQQQQLPKKRFAVHTPVGTPTQTQLLFDKFRNLGWSGGVSMFREEHGKVVAGGGGNGKTGPATTTPNASRNQTADQVLPTTINPQQSPIFVAEVDENKGECRLEDDDKNIANNDNNKIELQTDVSQKAEGGDETTRNNSCASPSTDNNADSPSGLEQKRESLPVSCANESSVNNNDSSAISTAPTTAVSTTPTANKSHSGKKTKKGGGFRKC